MREEVEGERRKLRLSFHNETCLSSEEDTVTMKRNGDVRKEEMKAEGEREEEEEEDNDVEGEEDEVDDDDEVDEGKEEEVYFNSFILVHSLTMMVGGC